MTARLFALLLVAACSQPLFAQQYKSKSKKINLENYDRKQMHYGFQLGYFNSFMKRSYSQSFVGGTDSINAIDPVNSQGFSIGLITNFSLGKSQTWDVRFVPNVSFYERQLQVSYREGTKEVKTIESTMVETPLLLMYKSQRRLNSRMFMIGGFTPSFQVGGKVDESNENNIFLQRANLEVTYGFGFHFYMKMFNFAPELRFSHGLNNILNQTGNRFTRNMERLNTHRVTLFINFEG